MLTRVRLQNVTVFEDFAWDDLGAVNVVIGANDTGKSSLLRMLYAVTRSLEAFTHTEGDRFLGEWSEVLAEKLRWTFQPRKLALGRLVRKGAGRLDVTCAFEGARVAFGFGASTTTTIRDTQTEIGGPFQRTLFVPPTEILTTRDVIVEARERLKMIGFGDTYVDLARALRSPDSHGALDPALKRVLDGLDDLFPGRIEQEESGELVYRRGRATYGIAQAAEGIKKVGAVTRLIRSRHIVPGSILFFDEPSANLHPQAALGFIRLLFDLAGAGVQIVLATHSYVALKQLELLAREHDRRTPLCVLEPKEGGDGVTARFADLRERIPANGIVDASVELLSRDLTLSAR
jgi:ABC-type transport system involved in cytochrome c biogenesis ATPase subunit